jgi:glycosyltransferase involved in cell wall biosynthesis
MMPLLHRHIWQRMPREWRRKLLFRTLALVAPRPSPDARAATPFVVVGALRSASGLGESARLCYNALKASGSTVFGIDVSSSLMQVKDFPDFEFADGGALTGPATVILHVNSPLVSLAMNVLGRRFVRQKYFVGCWAWELPSMPSDWRYGVPFVHEIWAPSRFTADAIKSISGSTPVKFLTIPVAAARVQSIRAEREPTGLFTVLTIFNMASSFARKNPLAVVEAFQGAFGDDPTVQLIVKTSNIAVYPRGKQELERAIGAAENIRLIDRTMSPAEMDALYNESDVVISLHRSEGFGLSIAEGMLRGMAVVATDSSSTTDFVTPETGIPISFSLVAALDPQGTYQHPEMKWADANIDAATRALMRLRADPALRRRLGSAASEFAAKTWTTRAYADAVNAHLGF